MEGKDTIHDLPAILEALLMAAEEPLSVSRLLAIFPEDTRPTPAAIEKALSILSSACEMRSVEIIKVGSGWRYQIKQEFSVWLQRLWAERPARYSQAQLEVLALIAYRQPITRAEIEEVRGVSVSSHMIHVLLERGWIKVSGHKAVPGRPALYITTLEFLDYFNLSSLKALPLLEDIERLDIFDVNTGMSTDSTLTHDQ